ncbi:MAG: protein-glutamate O-methyltransferase CheR [Polyangiaceae bacterium]
MNRPQHRPGASQESGQETISDSEFTQLTSLIRERTGLSIPLTKKALLTARLSERIRSLGMVSYSEYHRRVLSVGTGELTRMTEALCTHETRFFRDPEQLAFIEQKVLPGWLREAADKPRRIRIWSAGCSTGEEAFSIAMLLLAKAPPESGLTVDVLATDISNAALEKARHATFTEQRMAEVPESYRRRFFEHDAKTGEHRPTSDLRSVIRFQRLNLYDWHYPVTGRFDLVLCRNVLIYFDTETRAAVTRRLVERLAPDGLLFLGMAESLLAVRDGSLSATPEAAPRDVRPLVAVGPAIYAHADKPRGRPARPHHRATGNT